VDITNIKLDNFLIIGHADIDLSSRGLCRIAGENSDDVTSSSNGSGKSSIVEGIYWALFGETLRNLKSADSVVNKKSKKNCSVVLEIKEGETAYRIERYRKHSKNKNNLYLYINDVDSRGKDNRETQKYIESIIGMDKMAFSNSVIFGQGHSKNLKRFSEMTDSEKKETLEKILNLEIFVRSHEHVKDNLRSLGSARQEAARRARELSERVSSCEEKVTQALHRASKFDEEKSIEISVLEGKKASLEELIGALGGRVRALEVESVEDVEGSIADCEDFSRAQECDKRTILDTFAEKRNEQLLIKRGIERDISELELRVGNLLSDDYVGEECESCGGVVTSKSLHLVKEGYEFNIRDMQKSLSSVEGKLSDLSNKRKSKVADIEDNIREIGKIIAEQKSRLRDVTKIRDKRTELLLQIKTKKELVQAHHQAIERLEASENVWEQAALEYGTELEALGVSVTEFEKEVEKIDTDMNYYEFWKNAFSRTGIRSYLLDKIVPFLNERVGHYLEILTDGGIEAKFNTVKELASGEKRDNFNLEISNRNAADSYEGNSGGEKRRVDLGVALGFNDFVSARSGKRFNLLVLDEVFEGVDADGLYYVIKVLEDIARRKSSVFVITHRDELKSYFSDEILMERRDGLSYVRELSE